MHIYKNLPESGARGRVAIYLKLISSIQFFSLIESIILLASLCHSSSNSNAKVMSLHLFPLAALDCYCYAGGRWLDFIGDIDI